MQDRVKSSLVALRRILRATEGSARALARETGLTTPQLMVLDHLAERAEATPKTIAQSVGVAQATATALIEKLEARGFVRTTAAQAAEALGVQGPLFGRLARLLDGAGRTLADVVELLPPFENRD